MFFHFFVLSLSASILCMHMIVMTSLHLHCPTNNTQFELNKQKKQKGTESHDEWACNLTIFNLEKLPLLLFCLSLLFCVSDPCCSNIPPPYCFRSSSWPPPHKVAVGTAPRTDPVNSLNTFISQNTQYMTLNTFAV